MSYDQAVVLSAGEGRQIAGPTGMPMIVKAGAADTHGAYALIEYSHVAGAPGPPAHIHHHHEEAFYVLEGELTLLMGDQTLTVGAGGFALVPRGVVHRPSNSGAETARFFFITSGASDGFFVEMSEKLGAAKGRLPVEELVEIGSRWDVEYVGLPGAGPVVLHNEDSQIEDAE
jgi:mannose-6-phosphate isomerase-like protein (cupin superfamily)